MSISFIIPSHNNLRYLINAYSSIRKYAGNEHEIIILDDNSTDGTSEWLTSLYDHPNMSVYTSPTTVGHTVLYNIGASLAENEVISILHADMYIGPNYVENILKHLTPGSVVSSTRIEPPFLHPAGKEKIIHNCGMFPHEFNENKFVNFVEQELVSSKDKTTKGIFAPWTMYKSDYWAIGGHDELFAPYPYEDSDIFQRFILKGYRLIQSRDSLVYHFTCRGHKWTDDSKLGTVHEQYSKFELNARRNWFRKWKNWIMNDEFSYPVMLPRYEIGIQIKNCNFNLLYNLEPMCDKMWVDCIIEEYIVNEQKTTVIDLNEKIKTGEPTKLDVMLLIDGNTFDLKEDLLHVYNINRMLIELKHEMGTEFPVEGSYVIGNVEVVVKKLNDMSTALVQNNRYTRIS